MKALTQSKSGKALRCISYNPMASAMGFSISGTLLGGKI